MKETYETDLKETEILKLVSKTSLGCQSFYWLPTLSTFLSTT